MAKNEQALPLWQRWVFQFDYLLVLFILLATGFGILVLHGGTYDVSRLDHTTARQILWWKISLLIFLGALLTPYSWHRLLGWVFYLAALGLLLLLFFAAKVQMPLVETVRAGGAVSWLEMGPFRFQPSEFAKIATVMVLAQWLAWRREKIGRFWEYLPPLILAGLPMVFIFAQPDLGTASVFLPLPFVLLFVAGVPWRVVIAAVLIGMLVLGAGFAYLMTAESVPGLRQYQLRRIQVFLEPISSPFKTSGVEELLYAEEEEKEVKKSASGGYGDWNIRQAEMALGSGRMFGKGWKEGTQSRYSFLPQHHTDFIFSSLGEQFGLMGCLGLFTLYLLIAWRSLHIAVATTDPFGKYLVVGLLTIVFVHVFLNIGMSVRLLPVTGLPLPFFSYGGSFLASNYLIFGLIANVGVRRSARESRR